MAKAETGPPTELLSLRPAEAEEMLSSVQQDVTHMRGNLRGLQRATAKDRRNTVGRFREGETAALLAILDVVDRVPGAFEVLADKDNGTDPKRFETQLIRDRLATRAYVEAAQKSVQQLADDLGDMVLRLGELTRPVTLEAYAIAKLLANNSQELRSLLATAIDFYAELAAPKKPKETKKVPNKNDDGSDKDE